MMKDFLKSAEEQLRNSKDKYSVLTELGDHLETKKEYFELIGYDEASSAERANEAMGDGEVIGQRLNYIHRPKKSVINIIVIVVTNLLFLFFIPTEKSSYFLPFLYAVLIFICNSVNTAIAVKLKNNILSTLLIIFSCTTMRISTPKLIYPICNLVINQSTSEYGNDLYNLVRIVLMLLINAAVILPNAFNIYHCRQIKFLNNTKKQNKIASAICVFCLVMPCLLVIPTYPSYKLNDRLCEEQAEIRNELIEFIYDIDRKFESNEDDKLVEYLKNSEYDFDLYNNVNYFYSYDEPDVTVMHNYSYICCKGNWRVEVTFFEDSDNYILHLENRKMNCSHKYLFTGYEIEDALLEEFGEDEYDGTNGGVIGKSAEEIKNRMNDVNIRSLTINKHGKEAEYVYNWDMSTVLYGLGSDYYTFYIDSNGICYKYGLSLD